MDLHRRDLPALRNAILLGEDLAQKHHLPALTHFHRQRFKPAQQPLNILARLLLFAFKALLAALVIKLTLHVALPIKGEEQEGVMFLLFTCWLTN